MIVDSRQTRPGRVKAAMLYLCAVVLVGALAIGWVAGMWTFTKARQWCPACGATLRCPDCQHDGGYRNFRDPQQFGGSTL